jgi:Asp-tRNA(Asn)/Glu-tRNA(Gln) amidotransferase A subunit family amidase
MNFKDLSLEEIISKIKSGETTRDKVFEYFQNRIEKYDDKIKSFNFINKEGLNK